ncbi:MAG TPA: YfbU family protein [Longimicrobiaceae bacterium]
MKLSRTERWILANQYRIMAALDPPNASTYRSHAEALERGYANVVERISAHIVRDDTNRKESDEVDEILEMYDAMQRAFRTVEDNFGIDEWRLQFPGFDPKSELDYLSYASFALSREGRYPGLAHASSLEAGGPMLKHYRRMLEAWRHHGGSAHLDRNDVIAILNAQKQK